MLPDDDGGADPSKDTAPEAAMAHVALPATVGQLQLLHHWRRLSPDRRLRLLSIAREMATGENGH